VAFIDRSSRVKEIRARISGGAFASHSEPHDDGVGGAEADAADVADEAIGVVRRR
jgi:hypothetical protein